VNENTTTSYDLRRYMELLAETCNSVIEPSSSWEWKMSEMDCIFNLKNSYLPSSDVKRYANLRISSY
jgi:hypothetical protein